MTLRRFRLPLLWQVGLVVALFVAALATLWQTAARVVARDRARAAIGPLLARAGDALAERGAGGLVLVPEWPNTLDPADWDALDGWLRAEARSALATFPDVEGGYYIPSVDRYLGRHARQVTEKGTTHWVSSEPPARERALVESQVEEALDGDRAIFVVVDTPPQALALRAAPVWVDGRAVAVTWTLRRLDEPQTVAATILGYQRAAGLALGGITLALLLTVRLALTVRRQGVERERLQADLRRSERLAALGRLLAGVAHEVRNPLAGMRSTAQLWQRGAAPDAESTADLIAEVDRLEAIVSRLLQFSKADPHDLQPGDLNAVVAEAARLASCTAEGQGVRVEVDLEPSLPAVALSSPALVQVFRNLTSNALHAMPDGGTLRLSTHRDPGRRVVQARVADTGPGLAPEALRHLFEPFQTTKPDGTGLGLAIAREIALAHRGELRGENQNHGTTGAVFTLELPIDEPRRPLA